MADPDKTERASPHKRQEARKKGQVAKSVEVNTAFMLFSAFLSLKFMSKGIFEHLQLFMRDTLVHMQSFDFSEGGLTTYFYKLVAIFGQTILPFMLMITLAVIVANILQVGFSPSLGVLSPQLSRLNPVAGMKRFFGGPRVITELLKSILKITVTSLVVFSAIKGQIEQIFLTADMEPVMSVKLVSIIVYRIGMRLSMTLAVLAALDYFYQKWEYEKSLRMTKQEVKDEVIRYEGRPEVKSRIRTVQRQVAMRRMMQEVPKADVVITNPTHLAIALQYNPSEMVAPKLLAKGARLVAERIKEIAREHNIPVIENKPLAQMLFKTVEIGDMIPLSLYQAVADLLAYVWKTGKFKKRWF
jgi:flagellar biosynthesis protein FlhB